MSELVVEKRGIWLLCDSQSAIDLKNNQVYHARTKHIDVRFHTILSLVVRNTSIIALLALVACNDVILVQMDVNMTFLHGNLKEKIYLEQPEGFVET